jgi:HAE1 family hydrophobic/amphiphilic exporter-1
MYKQLAVVVAFALFASLAVALTLIPVLSSHVLRAGAGRAPGRARRRLQPLYDRSERFLDGMERRYRGGLEWALAHRKSVVFGTLGLFTASLLLVPFIGSELMPKTDEGEVRVDAEMAVGTRRRSGN